MLYASGGAGWMNTTFDGITAGPTFTEDSQTLFGWVVGGGLETKVTDSFLVRAEYLYGGFEDKSYTLTECGCVVDMNVEDFHSFRIGASYNFNFGGGYTAVPTKW